MKNSKNTIYEIAEIAGVSIATVSRAINPDTENRVSPETLKRIRNIISKYGYTPSLAARHMTTAAYKTIGLVFPHHMGIFKQDYYTRVLAGAADGLLETDYQLKMMMLKCEEKNWDRHNFHSGDALDGLIVTHWRSFFSGKAALEKINVPLAVINDVDADISALFISGNHEEGGRLAAEHFYQHEHRKAGVFTGSPDSQDSHLRLKGFRKFFQEKKINIPLKAVYCAHYQEQLAYQAAKNFIAQNPSITAVFCCNDGMAFGFIRAMKELGLKCPENISVIGYDDEKRAAAFSPALTTIRVPLEELGQEAASRIIQHLQGAADRKTKLSGTVLKPVELVVRNSVKQKK